MSPAVRAGWALAALGALAVAALTLRPIPAQTADAAATPLYCLVCGDRGGTDVILNLLLFMPLGAGLRLARRSWGEVLAASALLSLAVELLQLTVLAGRDPSLSDLLSNTTGGAIGAAVGGRLGALLFPTAEGARWLLAGGALAWLGLLGLSAWLQAPAVPDAPLESVWARPGPPREAFDGRVVSMRLNGLEMPEDGVPPAPGGTRTALAEGRFSLDATIVSGHAAPDSRWIYLIRTGSLPLLVLSQEGRELALAVPARALRFRLNPPTVLLGNAVPADSGRNVRIEGGHRLRRVWLASEHPGGSSSRLVALSPARGWALIAPFGLGLGPGMEAITAVVLAALVLPLGYWGAATRRPREAVALLAAALVLGLAATAALGGFPPVHWSEWAAGAAGAAAGWALRPAATYLQVRCGCPSISESSSS